MAFFTQKVWVEWIEQGLANGEYNYYDYKDLNNVEQIGSSKVYKAIMKKDEEEIMVVMKYIGNKLSTREVQSEVKNLILRFARFFFFIKKKKKKEMEKEIFINLKKKLISFNFFFSFSLNY